MSFYDEGETHSPLCGCRPCYEYWYGQGRKYLTEPAPTGPVDDVTWAIGPGSELPSQMRG